ncbi:GspE/PulE family protein [Vagococcus allomyrinae]|uniref:GspE/PulE family protein n=1 Tax=Vagococcus allomyrinae TaxID=2794353 RepID=UPI001FD7F2B6|nr:GspE/PulE family protein [Vagococcus allomyrinae]
MSQREHSRSKGKKSRKKKHHSQTVAPVDSTLDLFSQSFDKALLELIPRSFAKQYSVYPLRREEDRLEVAMSQPKNFSVLNELRIITGLMIEPVKAEEGDIQQLIVRDYPSDLNIDNLFVGQDFDQVELVQTSAANEESPVIKTVNALLEEAVDRRASDIHFDPQEKYLAVRIRIDGEMRELKRLPKNVQQAVTSRIKIISSLDITETRLPQDGRAMLNNEGRAVDLRVSILPTIHGEKIVIRILDRSVGIRKLDEFKFDPLVLKNFRHALTQPHGIILVTGPTGSGKSSTLYAALQELNTSDVNIITVEDPVEFQLEGINQVAVNSSIGLTFASGLRSILRQDPNIVMVGEIRDKETAEIAIRASMTGHLVLSTLHTNDSVSTINRLIDMEVDSFLVANALEGVLAQRLVKRVCTSCRVKVEATEQERIFLEEHGMYRTELVKGKGCAKCGSTGYQGRIAIQELMLMTAEMRRMVTNQATNDELFGYVKQQNMKFIVHDGIDKIIAGDTTVEELLKVVAEDT